jgi:hypothetical protein
MHIKSPETRDIVELFFAAVLNRSNLKFKYAHDIDMAIVAAKDNGQWEYVDELEELSYAMFYLVWGIFVGPFRKCEI